MAAQIMLYNGHRAGMIQKPSGSKKVLSYAREYTVQYFSRLKGTAFTTSLYFA